MCLMKMPKIRCFWIPYPYSQQVIYCFPILLQIVKKIVNPEEDAKIDDDNDKTLAIPAETPLAYNLCELYVKSDGAVELMIEQDAR